ncbi:hypothetical protein RB195_010987 [Necator americanus]|uniref:Uncharacterized protein n=1 Tax=Necator americanus TaxID=51031 RepID=A0ABR1D0C8_NECAM
MELMRLEHAIEFRQHAEDVTQDLLDLHYTLRDPNLPRAPKDVPPSLVPSAAKAYIPRVVPSPSSFSIRLVIRLSGVTSESGWSVQRLVHAWIMGSSTNGRAIIKQAIHFRVSITRHEDEHYDIVS